MERLWAPWRMDYIKQVHKEKGCFICQALKSKKDRNHLLLARYPKTVVIMNRYPYNTGHLLIAPKRHEGKLEAIQPGEFLECCQMLQKMKRVLDRVLKPNGFNIGTNLGRIAGAGLPGHFHIHLVPRWNGDTNYMPIIAGTKVISQALTTLYDQLKSKLR